MGYLNLCKELASEWVKERKRDTDTWSNELSFEGKLLLVQISTTLPDWFNLLGFSYMDIYFYLRHAHLLECHKFPPLSNTMKASNYKLKEQINSKYKYIKGSFQYTNKEFPYHNKTHFEFFKNFWVLSYRQCHS